MKAFPYETRVNAAVRSGWRTWVAGVLLGVFAAGQLASAQELYDKEYPQMGYGRTPPTDTYTKLMQRLAESGQKLPATDSRGYLDALLKELDIDPSSQVLVFSKSSLKQRFIAPQTPRSLFFNDEVYVGFVPGSRSLEVAAMDPNQGPVFFDVSQDAAAEAPFKQETSRCLRCHDSYSMTGGGVPRFMLSSVIAGADGNVVSHELSEITDMSTPLEQRWGGWYVTGNSGKQTHLGNFIVTDVAVLAKRPWVGQTNQEKLDTYADLAIYPRQTSDIIALLVLQHQVDVQNRLVRLNYESRKLLAENPNADDAQLQPLVMPVLQGLFMVEEAPLADAVEGNAGYREWFEQRGPATADGLSLRQFDLQSRTFRYRLSYLIYSAAVDALAEPVKTLLFRDIKAVLAGDSILLPRFELPAEERATITAILQSTKPEVLVAE
ncbi:MAG: hypothetical protein V4603_07510 [Pseudomonadota bacterium]